ncbi:Arabinose 5-phosphate isomerase KpsF [Stieleria magnilauensis]|uniref:Arabinose 5-phosphate isomerase KpsF n=2 Tax=Stieleria magnilauensis TaxID=2527963 RepID=A0ABX5XLN5_9BACT|nr:Arabinose 5-phosphate isomerase KpsF [Planctomycetes bacterium TBK1r]
MSHTAEKTGCLFDAFCRILSKEREALQLVETHLASHRDAIQNAGRILGQCRDDGDRHGRLVVSGVGKAGIIGRKVAATFSSTGISATFLHPVEALHGDLGFVRPCDTGLLFSYSGETIEVVRLAGEMRRTGCSLVSVTKSRDSSLGVLCDSSIEIGHVDEACSVGLAPSSSTTAMLAIGDALALGVAQSNGFSEQEFAKYHPAGSLGLRTRSVAAEMRTGVRMVCILPETPIREVLELVSQAKTGAAVLQDHTGKLYGIFTDGDLRRALLVGGSVLRQPVALFATAPCRAIRQTQSLSDAVRLFSQTGVDDLPVVSDEGTVVGLLVLKDIAKF